MTRRPAVAVIGGFAFVAVIAALILGFETLRVGEGVVFITDSGSGRWIRMARPSRPEAHPILRHSVEFRTHFETASNLDHARLEFRAVKAASIRLDGTIVHRETLDDTDWRRRRTVELGPVAAGPHVLSVRVSSDATPALLWADSDDLPLSTGLGWRVIAAHRDWQPVVLASLRPPAFAFSREFPHVARAFRDSLPWLTAVLLLVAFSSAWARTRDGPGIIAWWTPARVRWALIAAWGVLAINNIASVPAYVGLDVDLHLDYLRYLMEHHRIPIATQGGEMMQAPLAYLIMAPIYAGLVSFLAEPTATQLLRVIPMACSIAQVELAYRAVRMVYPARADLQVLGTLLGGLLPMHFYLGHAVANEPVAGITGGIVVLLGMKLSLRTEAPDQRSLAWLGGAFGLALLSKVTAVLLGPPLLAVLALRSRSLRNAVSNASIVFGIAFVLAGWYYLRNLVLMGSPFRGTWNADVGHGWWQEPGFRMPSQFFRFGEALEHPFYSAGVGFWDGLYSTLWLDGFLSGIASRELAPPWNYTPMLAGAWLALLPTLALVLGAARSLARGEGAGGPDVRAAQRFAVACIAFYLAAVVFLNLRVPFYCHAKASYLAATTPGIAVIGAAGFDRLARGTTRRALVHGGMACWVVAVYASFFVR
jgi:hypothetical protein